MISVVALSRSPLVHDEYESEYESESTPGPPELATAEGRTRAWRPPSF